jgi:molybdopterin molybdotransferase
MGVGAPDELHPLDRHRSQILGRLRALEPIELGLLEAHGCVLADDVTTAGPLPAFASSAMDGYAVALGDVAAGTALAVVGEAAAGSPADTAVAPGRAVRIMTGGVVPDGTGAIVPVEHVTEEATQHGERITLTREATPGAHVRGVGEDVAAGTVVVAAGSRLGAAELAMLASVGRQRAVVHPRPRVVVLSTGDELVEPGSPVGPGQLHDSNSFMLTAMTREAGALAFRHPIVRDDRAALTEALEGALVQGDLLLTSGGVSAGRYDLVKHVLAELGDVAFTKVGMQPGMPQAFGFLGRDEATAVPCFGLPGNPVSAFVSFEVFVRPALRRLQGRTDLNRPRITAVLDQAVTSPEHKVSFVRVTLHRDAQGAWRARPTGSQGSSLLHSIVAADGLAEVATTRTRVEAGEQVLVHLLMDAA